MYLVKNKITGKKELLANYLVEQFKIDKDKYIIIKKFIPTHQLRHTKYEIRTLDEVKRHHLQLLKWELVLISMRLQTLRQIEELKHYD